MAVHSKSVAEFTSVDISRAKPGLIYDAEGVTLIGKYTDELSAHRARREWQSILSSHFLLESDRDYELKTFCELEDNQFLLSCTFMSACGRYAFWRLVNRQAPEAEGKLNGARERIQKSSKGFLGSSWNSESKETTFVVNALEEQIQRNEENTSLVNRLLQLFK
jgi:hypothetical protein